MITYCHWIRSVVILIVTASSLTAAAVLGQELDELDKMRNGFATLFDQIDEKASDLLKRYDSRVDLGKIYYTLSHIEGQSGIQRPEKLIDYAQRALEYPQDPSHKLQLYMYWGNAIEIENRGATGASLATVRAEASKLYMTAIKVSLEIQRQLARESVNPDKVNKPVDRKETSDYERPNNKELSAGQREMVRRERLAEKIDMYRNAHENHLVYLYTKFPFDTNGMQSMAMEIIGDKEVVDRLVNRVNIEITKRIEKDMNGDLADVFQKLEISRQPTQLPAVSANSANLETGKAHPVKNDSGDAAVGNTVNLMLLYIIGLLLISVLGLIAYWFRVRKSK